VNFFGHASVAHAQSDSARFVLGAMLPDLTSMAAVRLRSVHHPDLAAGVSLHHETDRIFHACRPFRELCASALQELEAAGVRRGCARAVGHVGSELLLDGVLSLDRHAREAYARAIDSALRDRLDRELRWHGDADSERLRNLLERLAAGPLPEAYRDVDFVCDRLTHLLAKRPRLALADADEEPVRRWLARAHSLVQRDARALVDSLAQITRATIAG
jgi:acyl carrier protein phosphodiesterase